MPRSIWRIFAFFIAAFAMSSYAISDVDQSIKNGCGINSVDTKNQTSNINCPTIIISNSSTADILASAAKSRNDALDRIASGKLSLSEGQAQIALADRALTDPAEQLRVEKGVRSELTAALVGVSAMIDPADIQEAEKQIAQNQLGPAVDILLRIKALGSLAAKDADKSAAGYACFLLARVYEIQFDPSNSLANAVDALRLSPNNPRIVAYVAKTYAFRGKTGDALRLAKMAETDLGDQVKDAEAVDWLGDAYNDAFDWESAERLYTKALNSVIASQPDAGLKQVTYRRDLGALLTRMNRFSEAEEQFRKVFSLFNSGVDDDLQRMRAYNHTALNYLQMGCISAARDHADMLLSMPEGKLPKTDPLRIFTLSTRARIAFAENKTDEAKDKLSDARDGIISTFGTRFWRIAAQDNYLGEMLLQEGNFHGSLESFARAQKELDQADTRPVFERTKLAANMAAALSGSRQSEQAQSHRDTAVFLVTTLPAIVAAPLRARIGLVDAELAIHAGLAAAAAEKIIYAVETDPTDYVRSTLRRHAVTSELGSVLDAMISEGKLNLRPRYDCSSTIAP